MLQKWNEHQDLILVERDDTLMFFDIDFLSGVYHSHNQFGNYNVWMIDAHTQHTKEKRENKSVRNE